MNKRHGYNIKPMIRLVKYWNARGGNVFGSFLLEEWLVNRTWSQANLKDYVYSAFDNLNLDWSAPQWKKDELGRAKEIVNNTRSYERQELPEAAEKEIKKLLPEIV